MTRHKSRVARRRRRSARRGTRKQSGGGVLDWLLGKKPDSPGAAPAVAEPSASVAEPSASPVAAKAEPWWKKINIFGSSNDGNKATPPAPSAVVPAAVASPAPHPSDQGGGRKTRHRRRSPRHYRK